MIPLLMGHSNIPSVSSYCQNSLLQILRVLLEKRGRRSLETWVERVVESARFRHMTSEEYYSNTFHCVDEEDEIMSVTFPAIMDLEGEYSRVRPSFSLEGHEQVSVNPLFLHILSYNIKDISSFCS